MNNSQFYYRLTLLSYFGLLIVLSLWFLWLAPSPNIPKSIMLFFGVGPLLLPLRGLLHGKAYTFAWSSLLIMIYFIHGVVEAYADPEVRLLACIEILLVCLFYIGAIFYPRYHNRETASQTTTDS
jgi:uncharacterized membrane protein